MRPTILAFSGAISSGKTILSKSVSEFLGWKYISFGEFVRRQADLKGLDHSRSNLQSIGETLANNPKEFVAMVLKDFDWEPVMNAVVDGIRHSSILLSLRILTSPSNVFLIHLYLEDEIRRSRIDKLYNLDEEGISRIESHSTESEVKEILYNSADLKINSNKEVQVLVKETLNWLERKQKTYLFQQ